MWSNINTILGKNRKATSTSFKLNGIIINEPDVIASSFNSYFNSIPTTLSKNIDNNILTFENYLVDQIHTGMKICVNYIIVLIRCAFLWFTWEIYESGEDTSDEDNDVIDPDFYVYVDSINEDSCEEEEDEQEIFNFLRNMIKCALP